MILKTAICICMSVSLLFATEIKTVQNEVEPKSTPMTLKLVKTLEKGPEQGDDYLWTGAETSLQTDARGHMFIVDTAENRILEYDTEGKLVRQIGKAGEGPGEFQRLRSFTILEDGTALAFENMGAFSALTFFDKNMEYKDRKTISGIGRSPRYVFFSPDGSKVSSFASIWDTENNREITEFVVMDQDFNLLKTLGTWESIIFDQARVSDSAFWVEFLAARLQGNAQGHTVFTAFDHAGNLYAGKASTYEVTVYSPELKPLFKFAKAFDRKPLTEEELDAIVNPLHQSVLTHLPDSLHAIVNKTVVAKAVEEANFLPYKMPIGGIIPMGQDHILVVHEQNAATLEGQADIFTDEGQYLGSFRHGRNGLGNMQFHDGKAYVLEQDENEELIMVRYDAKLVPASKATSP